MIRALFRWYTRRRFIRALNLAELELREEAARKAHKPVKPIQEERKRRVTEALR